jgi:hypothetical protein
LLEQAFCHFLDLFVDFDLRLNFRVIRLEFCLTFVLAICLLLLASQVKSQFGFVFWDAAISLSKLPDSFFEISFLLSPIPLHFFFVFIL